MSDKWHIFRPWNFWNNLRSLNAVQVTLWILLKASCELTRDQMGILYGPDLNQAEAQSLSDL
jgi:hypothetical protein